MRDGSEMLNEPVHPVSKRYKIAPVIDNGQSAADDTEPDQDLASYVLCERDIRLVCVLLDTHGTP
jgi:hypothetical protein